MRTFLLIAILSAMLTLVACGGSEDKAGSSSAGSATSQTSGASSKATVGGANTTLHATLTEFALLLDKNEAPSGRVTIDAKNDGTVAHEVVIAHTDLDANKLPIDQQTGTVDVAKLEVAGKLTQFAAKTVSSDGFNLAPGRYVLFCNVPAHYQAGMQTVLTIR